ncbi:MAG TPA: RDD family protein [Methanomicrobia archaeon]|nr:RDD family protein [Methanomicrobia archaeon]
MADYASLGSRAVALIIDYIILGIIIWVITVPFGAAALISMRTLRDPMAFSGAAVLAVSAISMIIWLLYFTYLEGSSGQTLGKRVMNIKVTKESGESLTFVDALIRTLCRIIDMLPTLYIFGIIIILLTDKNQRIGDLAAHTTVVKA